MFDKLKKKIGSMEAAEELTFKSWGEEEPKEEAAPASTEVKTEPVKAPEAKSEAAGVELKVMRPECYEEVGDIADNLLAGCTVVLNMEALDKPVIFRMLDFLNGVTYCTDGEIKKVAASTFIITPHSNIDISDM